jgi:hypothetical protein
MEGRGVWVIGWVKEMRGVRGWKGFGENGVLSEQGGAFGGRRKEIMQPAIRQWEQFTPEQLLKQHSTCTPQVAGMAWHGIAY